MTVQIEFAPDRRSEWKRGWLVVAASTVGIGTGAGLAQYTSSLFVEPLQAAFGWTRGEIGTIGAFGLLGALSAPLIGRLADRFGARRVATICILAATLAYLGLSVMQGRLWQFAACSLLLGAAAPGCTGLVYSRAVVGWFERDRGLALGIIASGLPVATLLITPLLAAVIRDHGVQSGYLVLAGAASLIGLPLVLLGVRDAPRAPLADDHVAGPLGAIIRSRTFWLLALILFLVNMPATGVLTQLAPLLTSKGASAAQAATAVGVFAAFMLFGRIGVGWLFDRLDARRVAAAVTGLSAAACIILFANSGLSLLVFAAVMMIGLLQGAETDVLGYFVGRHFDHDAFGFVYGALFTISLMGTAIGIMAFGHLFDLSGNYDLALIIAMIILVVVATLYLLIPRERQIR